MYLKSVVYAFTFKNIFHFTFLMPETASECQHLQITASMPHFNKMTWLWGRCANDANYPLKWHPKDYDQMLSKNEIIFSLVKNIVQERTCVFNAHLKDSMSRNKTDIKGKRALLLCHKVTICYGFGDSR